MSMKKEPPPLPELVTLNKGLKLAEQWVKKMSEELEEAEGIEMEGRPSRLGLGAKVPHKPRVGALNDPVERRLHKLGIGRKKFDRNEDSTPPPKNEIHSGGDEDEDEDLDSRTNAFNKKRAVPSNTTPQAKKKQK